VFGYLGRFLRSVEGYQVEPIPLRTWFGPSLALRLASHEGIFGLVEKRSPAVLLHIYETQSSSPLIHRHAYLTQIG
jgi:hypothetical protein